jgi:hypothetical protein
MGRAGMLNRAATNMPAASVTPSTIAIAKFLGLMVLKLMLTKDSIVELAILQAVAPRA